MAVTDDLAARARKLERINAVLIERVEKLEASRGSAWSMFQAAAALEKEVEELRVRCRLMEERLGMGAGAMADSGCVLL